MTHEEQQYLDLIRRVLDTGESRPDRTGTGTISLFAPPSFRFSLADNTLPLLTTKRTFLRGIFEELRKPNLGTAYAMYRDLPPPPRSDKSKAVARDFKELTRAATKNAYVVRENC